MEPRENEENTGLNAIIYESYNRLTVPLQVGVGNAERSILKTTNSWLGEFDL